MEIHWDWKVTKTSFSRLEVELRQLASTGFDIYQIVSVEEVKPARAPFEVVIISRKLTSTAVGGTQGRPFGMSYSPPDESTG